jgi:diguanylate cyclase (GGDEF)-like protein
MSSAIAIRDYRVLATRYVAIVAVLVVTPFVFLHFFQGRTTLGLLLAIVAVVLVASARSSLRGQPMSLLLLLGFVPTVTTLLALSLVSQGITAVLWVFPTLMTFYLMMTEKQAWVSNVILVAVIVGMSVVTLNQDEAVRIAASLIAVSMFSIILTRVITHQQQNLHRQITTDSLTGVSDRILLNSTLEQAARRVDEEGQNASLVALDLDYFKDINDEYGHDVGDEVLKRVGATLRRSVRKSDSVFRFGGEEFILLFADIEPEQCMRIVEKLRLTIEGLTIEPVERVSASFGLAHKRKGESWQDWMKRADVNLYEAKRLGRNRVVDR